MRGERFGFKIRASQFPLLVIIIIIIIKNKNKELNKWKSRYLEENKHAEIPTVMKTNLLV